MLTRESLTRNSEVKGGPIPCVPFDRRVEFIEAVRQQTSILDLCTRFGLRERTAYNWKKWAEATIAAMDAAQSGS